MSLAAETLSVSKTGSGGGEVVSSPAGIECGVTCSHAFLGGVVVLTATPAPGSVFAGWSGGDCSGTGPTCKVTLSAATDVTAEFTLERTLTVLKSGSGGGEVVSTTPVAAAGIECGMTCSHAFPEGTRVVLAATANGTSVFVGWSGGGCSGAEACEVSMSAATQVTAVFEARVRLTVSKSGSGGGRVVSSPAGIDCGATCSHLYQEGASVTLSATANATSTFTGWSGGGCSGTGTCEVSMSESVEVTAVFGAVAQGACPNEQLRSEQPYGLKLPDCRAYEMVSPLDKNDNNAVILESEQYVRASVSGEAITYASFGSFTEPVGAEFNSQYLSRRGPGGWSTSDITPPYKAYSTEELDPDPGLIYTPELSSGLALTDALLSPEATPGYFSLYLADFPEGSYQLLSNAAAGVVLGGEQYGTGLNEERSALPVGASTDLSHVVFEVERDVV